MARLLFAVKLCVCVIHMKVVSRLSTHSMDGIGQAGTLEILALTELGLALAPALD